MVETIRNKSTILKSRKLNMEKNGHPGTLHMEIIEEEPLQENYGTDFKNCKKMGRNHRYQVEKVDSELSEEEQRQSNQSSPDK